MHYGHYRFLGRLIFTLFFPCFLLYSLFTGKHRIGLRQRLGFYRDFDTQADFRTRIWLHAASVGEVQVARSLIIRIQKQFPGARLFLSTMTEAGYKVAREQIDGSVTCFFAPIDLPGVVNRALATIRPDIYICLETELWPNLLRQANKQGVKIFLLNARLTARALHRYEKLGSFIPEVLANFSHIAVIQAGDGERYRQLGTAADKITVTGNAKYELATDHINVTTADRCRQLLELKDDTSVLIAGSTHSCREEMLIDRFRRLAGKIVPGITNTAPVSIDGNTYCGEDEMLIDCFHRLSARLPELVWIIAPRYLERLPEIEEMLTAHRLPFDKLSGLGTNGRQTRIVLVDTMGELAALYSVATFVFCGGSLVDSGGHNLMEAAAWNKPVCYGPYMKDFADARDLLESAGGGFTVKTPTELTDLYLKMIDEPEFYRAASRRAGEIAMAQRGAAARQIELVKQVYNS